MPTLAPRICCRSWLPMVSRSRPSNSAVPLTRAPRTRPMMVWVDTLLPEPDSPTIPRVFPASTSKESPRTACTMPSGVRNETRRSLTSRSATRYLPLTQDTPRVRGAVLSLDVLMNLPPASFTAVTPGPVSGPGSGQGGHAAPACPPWSGGLTGQLPGELSQTLAGSNCWIAGTHSASAELVLLVVAALLISEVTVGLL